MSAKQKHPLDIKKRGSNVRSASLRKLGKDGTTWTPTEKVRRDKLLRQFRKNKGEGPGGVSREYRDGYDQIDWTK